MAAADAPPPQKNAKMTPLGTQPTSYDPIAYGPVLFPNGLPGAIERPDLLCLRCNGPGRFLCNQCKQTATSIAHAFDDTSSPNDFVEGIRTLIANNEGTHWVACGNVSYLVKQLLADVIRCDPLPNPDPTAAEQPDIITRNASTMALLDWILAPDFNRCVPDVPHRPVETKVIRQMAQLIPATRLWIELNQDKQVNQGIAQYVGTLLMHAIIQQSWMTFRSSVTEMYAACASIIEQAPNVEPIFTACLKLFWQFPERLALAQTVVNTPLYGSQLHESFNPEWVSHTFTTTVLDIVQQIGMVFTAAHANLANIQMSSPLGRAIETLHQKIPNGIALASKLFHTIWIANTNYTHFINDGVAPLFALTPAMTILALAPIVYRAPWYTGLTQTVLATAGKRMVPMIEPSMYLRGTIVSPVSPTMIQSWDACSPQACSGIYPIFGDINTFVREHRVFESRPHGLSVNYNNLLRVVQGFDITLTNDGVTNKVQNKLFSSLDSGGFILDDVINALSLALMTPMAISKADSNIQSYVMGLGPQMAAAPPKNTEVAPILEFLLKSYGRLGLATLVVMTAQCHSAQEMKKIIAMPKTRELCGVTVPSTPQESVADFVGAILTRNGLPVPTSIDYHRMALDLVLVHLTNVYCMIGRNIDVSQLTRYWATHYTYAGALPIDDPMPIRPAGLTHYLSVYTMTGGILRHDGTIKARPKTQLPSFFTPLTALTAPQSDYVMACYRRLANMAPATGNILPGQCHKTFNKWIFNAIAANLAQVDMTPLIMSWIIPTWRLVRSQAVRPILQSLEAQLERLYSRRLPACDARYVVYDAYDRDPNLDVRLEPSRLVYAGTGLAAMCYSHLTSGQDSVWLARNNLPIWHAQLTTVAELPRVAFDFISQGAVEELCRRIINNPTCPVKTINRENELDDGHEESIALQITEFVREIVINHKTWAPGTPLPFIPFIFSVPGHFYSAILKLAKSSTIPGQFNINLIICESIFNPGAKFKYIFNWLKNHVKPMVDGALSQLHNPTYTFSFRVRPFAIQGNPEFDFGIPGSDVTCFTNACGYISAYLWGLHMTSGEACTILPSNMFEIVNYMRRWLHVDRSDGFHLPAPNY